MNMKRASSVFLIFCALVSLSACKASFVGNKIKTSERFLLSFAVLNSTQKETLRLEKGEKLSVSVELREGEVSLLVQKRGEKNGEALYRGNGLQNESFTLVCAESGTYLIEVTGKDAKGKLNFQKLGGEALA